MAQYLLGKMPWAGTQLQNREFAIKMFLQREDESGKKLRTPPLVLDRLRFPLSCLCKVVKIDRTGHILAWHCYYRELFQDDLHSLEFDHTPGENWRDTCRGSTLRSCEGISHPDDRKVEGGTDYEIIKRPQCIANAKLSSAILDFGKTIYDFRNIDRNHRNPRNPITSAVVR